MLLCPITNKKKVKLDTYTLWDVLKIAKIVNGWTRTLVNMGKIPLKRAMYHFKLLIEGQAKTEIKFQSELGKA